MPNDSRRAEVLADAPLRMVPQIEALTFLDALTWDPRPTCVVDLNDQNNSHRVIFWNNALHEILELRECVEKGNDVTGVGRFRWTSFTVAERWAIHCTDQVSTTLNPGPTLVPPSGPRREDGFPSVTGTSLHPSSRSETPAIRPEINATVSVTQKPNSELDARRKITIQDSSATVTPSTIRARSSFATLFREFDWASTELGDIKTWPTQLVEISNLMLASPTPVGIYWGRSAIVLYNEPMLPWIGVRHPQALGRRMEEAFPESWEGKFKPLFEDILEKRIPHLQYNDRRMGYKDGILEEVFWDVTFIPIFEDQAEVIGTWGTLYDISNQEFWRRRVAILLRLTSSVNHSESFDAMWSALVHGFDSEDRDVPHLLIYAISERPISPSGSQSCTSYQLRSSLGYDASNSPYKNLDLINDKCGLAPLLRQSLAADVSIRFARADVDLDEAFWDAFEGSNSETSCQAIVVVPIRPTQSMNVMAYLVVGLNPFVRYDQGYHEFIDLTRRHLSSTMASILLREEEVSRERLVASESANQLDAWKAEAKAHELRFTRLAETVPIGICTYAPDGTKTYANDGWYDMFGMSREDEHIGPSWWSHVIHPEDLVLATTMLTRLLVERQAVTFEIRAHMPPKYLGTPTSDGYIWILVSACAEPTGDGPQTVIACFTDINEQKRAEDIQNRRLQDVMNAKRQQEAFIDMTSHEIRNPLSVVLQCGEEIISTCTRSRLQARTLGHTSNIPDLENILDAAETIEFCTLHQKRIVDDILTLSKLESELLPMTPDRTRPMVLVEGVMKLFEREIRKSDMILTISAHRTFHECQLDQVLLDTSRVSQIVINLVSNAIKFTKTQNVRKLSILLGGSMSNNPPAKDWPVAYMSRLQPPQQDTFGEYWSPSESAYLHFAVVDTGAGMSEVEQQTIFSRFTQASPRTHVKYGGSGLGLYICRALSETHGGQIGCTSSPGKGSAFGFHIEVGKCASHVLGTSTTSSPTSHAWSIISESTNGGAPVNSSDVISPTSIIAAKIEHRESISETLNFHVLVVEDNLLNQKVLRRQLEKGGHTVVVAQHGQDALDVLQTTVSWSTAKGGDKSFDFIFMDIEMPVMNGLTCTQRIREYEEQGMMIGHIPIIATTGNARDENIGQALAVGMDQVVLKPFSLSTLLPIAQRLRQQYVTATNHPEYNSTACSARYDIQMSQQGSIILSRDNDHEPGATSNHAV